MKKAAIDRRGGVGSRTITTLCLVQFVDVLGVTVVVTALPSMLSGLGASSSAAPLVVTGYAMFFGGLLMLGSRLGDRYGHKRVLIIGLGCFAVASLLAATASAVAALIAARCLQGAAAALSVPTALRLLLEATPREEARRRALAGWSAAGAVAGASGFLLGGVLTDLAGWRAIFWLNLPLAALLAAAVLAGVSRSPEARRGRLDLAGAATLTAGMMAIVGGASLLEHPERRALGMLALGAGAALVALFLRVERRAPQPLLPAAALRHPCLRTATGAAALNTATTSSVMTLATLYVQDVRGASPTAAGLLLVPCSLCVVVGSTAAAPLLRRHAPRVGIAVGLGTIAAGTGLLLALAPLPWLLPVGVGILGAGLGVSSVAANSLGTAVAPTLQGAASGMLNTGAQLGTAVGVSAVLLIAAMTEHTGLPVTGRSLAWACAAAAALTAALAFRRRQRDDFKAGAPSLPRGSSQPTGR
jgi:MFS family permease